MSKTDTAAGWREIEQREAGLARQLSPRQLSMIAIGGAIGTGLFLGSGLAVRIAGPAVIVTYALGAAIALLLMGTLAEMAVAHPTAGSFGVYAELYLSRWAGFVMRYTYWAAQVIAIGGEATAVGVYCQWWWPGVPQWVFVVGCSAALIAINASSVGNFGEVEYWFSMIKVVAIILFIVLGLGIILGFAVPGGAPQAGFANLTAHGGFAPHGLAGIWMALVIVIFSYIGTETVAVTAGEAKDPRTALPRAMRSMLVRLVIFYLGSITVLVAIVPWTELQPGAGVTASPFVRVFGLVGIPAAAHVINFVVLTAALSSMNCNLYLATRMIFSLSRGGYAPAALGRVSSRGTPWNALMISGAGLAVAVGLADFYPDRAYVYMFGVALFGGLFVWMMIFVTHLAFRRKWAGALDSLPVRVWGFPYTTVLGAVSIFAILVTTQFVDGMQLALTAGVPWLIFISVMYLIVGRKFDRQRAAASSEKEQL